MKPSSSPKDQKLLKILQDMEASGVDYPEDLLSARRAAFMEELTQRTPAVIEEPSSVKDQAVIDLLDRVRSIPESYPPQLLSARRAAYRRQVAWMNWVGFWTSLWTSLQRSLPVLSDSSWGSFRKYIPASLMAFSFALAAAAGLLFYENQTPVTNIFRASHGIVKSAQILTTDTREVRIICKPGYQPPLCLAGEFKREDDLMFVGNGAARPAVAKDTAPGNGSLHQASHVNDGMYGPGASWTSDSRNSWIKIDLGKITPINTVKIGKDRLGKLQGGNPGRFIIAVALSDNVYADGNNSNDDQEYKVIYDSKVAGFQGTIAGAETVTAQFTAHAARYIKITFQNKGTTIDEVEAFMVQPPVLANAPEHHSRDDDKPDDTGPSAAASSLNSNSTQIPVIIQASSTFLPTNTSVPSYTATLVPTMLYPTSSATSLPTRTPLPTRTATIMPTRTPLPTSTATSVPTSTPYPTDTAVPPPTSTPYPTDTVAPPPTSTPYPTDTPEPPPTDTPAPMQIVTDVPPTDTAFP
jgi:hypothetical protein